MHKENRRKAFKKLLLSAGFLASMPFIADFFKDIHAFLAEKRIVPPRVGYLDGKFDEGVFVWAMENTRRAEFRWRHEWVMVIDLEKCDGCALCQNACIAAHEPLPEQTWIRVYILEGPDGETYPLPRPCMQCQRAPCVSVCPVGANYYNQDGIVLIDKDRCIGCRMCMAACPYGARYFNWKAPQPSPREEHGWEYYHPVGVVEKCMFCYSALEKGELPPCVKACVMGAIYVGDRNQDTITNGAETRKLSELLAERGGFRLLEELGTEPRVIYLPGKGPKLYPESKKLIHNLTAQHDSMEVKA